MSNTNPQTAPQPVVEPLRLKELATVLVRHYGIKEGSYEPLVEFTIGVGSMGPTPEMAAPSAIVSISRIGLVKVDHATPHSVDAAEVNPGTKKSTATRKQK
ncbi:MAG TPA: hypothetical protein PKC12_05785 [Thiobacillaceae bacterium]|nr:hypothetical protein [Thiobacillaceae bacterium]